MKQITLLIFAALFLALQQSGAATLKILNPSVPAPGNSLPLDSNVSAFSSILANDFDTITTGILGDPSYLTGADAIIVNLPTINYNYLPAELSTLTEIFSGTTRVLIFFENDTWITSNTTIAQLAGGPYVGQITGPVPISGSSPLSAGITGLI